MTGSFDVAVIGGGPAGCATALSLRLSFPELSVLLLEGGDYSAYRAGEILPPAANGLLSHLGVYDSVSEAIHFGQTGGQISGRAGVQAIPSRAVSSAWGSARLAQNHAIFSAIGGGWHLNRNLFDAMLAGQCETRGVHLLLNTSVRGAGWGTVRFADGWVLQTNIASFGARFVVDATGRTAAFARLQGARLKVHDRLTSYTRVITGSDTDVAETLVEAAPQGWWYTAPIPGGRRVVSYMTDADIGRDAGLPSIHVWMKLLNATEHVRQAVGKGHSAQDCMVRPAATSHLDHVCGVGWLAVGDASAAFDPLAAQGITKAMRNGILASYAAADSLLGREAQAAERYSSILDNQFAAYQRAHRKHFALERRWADSPFWSRRQTAPLVEGAA